MGGGAGAAGPGVAGSGPGGASAGATGAAGSTAGAAGTGTGGSAAGTGGGAAGTTGTGGGTGGTAPGACPANATFCSGFEEASGPPVNSPVGTATVQAYTGTFNDFMMLDTTVHNSGLKSLKVLSTTSPSAYKMLSVPVPGPTFWVRLYTRSDVTFGESTAIHNSFFQAQTAAPPNSAGTVQVAEQWCQVLLNANDMLFPTGLSSCSTTGPVLAANQWHCVEALFDGPNGNVQVYADGAKIIDAANWTPAKQTFAAFEFGFVQYSGPARNMWFDDVVVAPTRVGCP